MSDQHAVDLGSHQELLGLSDPMTLQRAFSERFFLCLYKGLRKFVMICYFTVFGTKQLVRAQDEGVTSPSKEALVFPSRGEEEAVNGGSRQQEAWGRAGRPAGWLHAPLQASICSFLTLG